MTWRGRVQAGSMTQKHLALAIEPSSSLILQSPYRGTLFVEQLTKRSTGRMLFRTVFGFGLTHPRVV